MHKKGDYYFTDGVMKIWNGSAFITIGTDVAAQWGMVGGDIASQTDLMNLLNGKVAKTTTVNGHALSDNVTVTKGDVGLGNVDNTSDANKPVSNAQAQAIAAKLDKNQGVANAGKTVVVGQDGYLKLANTSKQIVYGFHINKNDSNPATCVTYLEDAIGMTPAYMDYTNDVFNYGSWRNAFFMPKPCMVKSDGTVDYYLDPNDYTKKVDGTASDISDYTYDGNAMMQWGDGVNIIWMKIVADANDTNSGSVYIANYQADSDYTCYPFINKNGVRKNHFYTPIYNGSLDTNNKLRSISGKPVIQSKTAIQERTYAQANGNAWDTEFWCDIQLIDNLLILIGKSINTQAVFGLGNQGGYDTSKPQYNILATGTMDTKGMFWGKNVSSQVDNSGVKVFGMENYWANQWRRFVGLIMDAGTVKAKLTYGTQDGSTATDYNAGGTGYLVIGSLAGISNGFLKEQTFHSTGLYPAVTGGSATTYYSDYCYLDTAGAGRYALRGGNCNDGARCGAFYVNLYDVAATTYWSLGASVSLKPLN